MTSESGFLAHLRKRHFVRWAIAYAAAAWVLLQVAELLFGIFSISSDYLRALAVVLVFGFFVAMILAWFHGEKGQQNFTAVELVLISVVSLGAIVVIRSGDFLEVDVGATANIFEGKLSRRVTANSYYEGDPSWSPDSTSLVFVSERSGNSDLWLLQRSGNATQLTFDAAEDSQPAWSPDGHTILFVSSRAYQSRMDRSVFFGYSFGGDIWSVPAFGGEPKRILEDGYNPAWSPDGERFAFDSSRAGPRRIWTAASDGQGELSLSADASDLSAHIRPDWSPDGNWIVYERQPGSQASAGALVLISADGKNSFQITDGKHRDMSPAWAGPNSVVFASDRGGAINLWQVDVDFSKEGARGEPVQISLGAGEDFAAAVAADGTLAYSTSRRLVNLWRVSTDPLTMAVTSEPERIMSASWNDFAPAMADDNSALAFSSDRDGKADIWLLSDGESEPQQLTDRTGQDLQPVFSSDGSKLMFFSDENGKNDIWILPLRGGAPVVITPPDSNDVNPYWSSDGSEIGFTSDRSGQSEIWKMNVDGSGALKLTDIGTLGHTARWSPNDEWLLFTSIAEGNRDVWAVNNDGVELKRITTAETQDAHGLWSPDGQTILYLSDHRQVYATDIDGEQHRLILDLNETIDYTHLSPDGTAIIFTRQKVESDIWLIE